MHKRRFDSPELLRLWRGNFTNRQKPELLIHRSGRAAVNDLEVIGTPLHDYLWNEYAGGTVYSIDW